MVTGCTSQPLPKGTFCALHQGEVTPVTEKVTKETRNTLKKKKTTQIENFEDHLYVVESIHKMEDIEV